MNRESLRRYAATAYQLLWSERKTAVTVRPGPGLCIVLSSVDDALTLKAITEEQPLTPDDIAVIGDAFSVPADTEPTARMRTIQHPVSRRPVDQHSVIWQWREI